MKALVKFATLTMLLVSLLVLSACTNVNVTVLCPNPGAGATVAPVISVTVDGTKVLNGNQVDLNAQLGIRTI